MSTEHTSTTTDQTGQDQPAQDHKPGIRPPLPKGNALTLRHGARSPRVYGAVAEKLTAGLLDSRPDLANYPEAVAAWATAEAQATLLRRHLEEVGTLDPATGEPRSSALTWLGHFERLAIKHRATLGLDPRSEAELARERATAVTLGANLEALAEQGRQALTDSPAGGTADDLAGHVLEQVKANATPYDSRYPDDPKAGTE